MKLPLTPGRYRTRNGRLVHIDTVTHGLAIGRLDIDPKHQHVWYAESGMLCGWIGRRCWDLIARVGGAAPMITRALVDSWLKPRP